MGGRVAAVAQALGRPLMPWQRLVADVAGELDPGSGLPVYREVRVSVPRQSGKTTLMLAEGAERCTQWGPGQQLIYAAQDGKHSRAKWEEHAEVLEDSVFAGGLQVRRSNGSEHIRWRNRSRWGLTASMLTSAHGPVLDVGVIDEAWAQQDDRLVVAFRPAMMTRASGQLWLLSTAGDDRSVFWRERVDDGRARVEAGEQGGVAFFDWSAGVDDDPDDPATWWGAMPSLGSTVTEATVAADHDALDETEFRRSYLNLWVSARSGSPIAPPVWSACAGVSVAGRPLAVAVDVDADRGHASIGVACHLGDGRVHVEVADHRSGTDWVAARVAELVSRWEPLEVVVDPVAPVGSLLVELGKLGVTPRLLTGREYAWACAGFFDDVVCRRVAHRGQPPLDAAVASASRRRIGDAWGWARPHDVDSSPLVAVTLARYGLVADPVSAPTIF